MANRCDFKYLSGSAAFGAWFVYKRRKMVKEEGLALTSGISGMLGVTEPAMFGELTSEISIYRCDINVLCIGAIVGMNNLEKLVLVVCQHSFQFKKNFGQYILL